MHACINRFINYNDLPRTNDTHLGIKKNIYIYIYYVECNQYLFKLFTLVLKECTGGKPINQYEYIPRQRYKNKQQQFLLQEFDTRHLSK